MIFILILIFGGVALSPLLSNASHNNPGDLH